LLVYVDEEIYREYEQLTDESWTSSPSAGGTEVWAESGELEA